MQIYFYIFFATARISAPLTLLNIILKKETGCWEPLKEVKVGCLEIEILTIWYMKKIKKEEERSFKSENHIR